MCCQTIKSFQDANQQSNEAIAHYRAKGTKVFLKGALLNQHLFF